MKEAHSGKPLIVVEIGNDWLKLLQAEPSRQGVVITRLHLEKFDAMDGALSRSIAQAIRKHRMAGIPVVACLPRQMANFRMLELPSTDPDEIADMIELQIGKQTPYSRDEIVSDYRIAASDREGYSRVMLAIVQRSVLRQRFYVLEEAGLDVERMTVTSEGVLNWCRRALQGLAPGVGTAVLDIDSFYSDFLVVAGEGLVFTRSILVGANHLLGDDGKWKEKLIQEVKRSLEIFQSESRGLSVGGLYVTGAGANFPDLSKDLAASFAFPTQTADCLKSVVERAEGVSAHDPRYQAVSLTPLVGIALAPDALQYNLIPDSVTTLKRLVEKARTLTALGILAAALLVSASLCATLRFYFLQHRLRSIRNDVARTEAAVRKVVKEQDVIHVVRERQGSERAAINVLYEIQRQVPRDVYFDAVDIDLQKEKDQILLEGTAESRKLIYELIQSLEKSELFKDVKEGGSTSTDRAGRFKFQIVGTLEEAS